METAYGDAAQADRSAQTASVPAVLASGAVRGRIVEHRAAKNHTLHIEARTGRGVWLLAIGSCDGLDRPISPPPSLNCAPTTGWVTGVGESAQTLCGTSVIARNEPQQPDGD
jgi:hypothetical protein